jgi:hypothetical protein
MLCGIRHSVRGMLERFIAPVLRLFPITAVAKDWADAQEQFFAQMGYTQPSKVMFVYRLSSAG